MPVSHITIYRTGDEQVLWDAPGVEVDPDEPWDVVLIEGGMTSGKPAVAVRWHLPDGSYAVAQTSLEQIIGIMAAARGAFPEAFAGGPFE